MNDAAYVKVSADAQAQERSTCGFRQRLLKKDDNVPASITRLRVDNAKPHWHKQTHEYYYVLGGEGTLIIDNERVSLAPGDCVWIKPYHMHHAEGDLEALIIGVPAYDPEDTFFDDVPDENLSTVSCP
ncbi:MAG: cupin domain-containing protein [Candidatus Hydrogenedentes bacterium]|nr:cupin domain-containing protein [Candidatus Hydrogenedentota bacterium]